MTSKEVNDRISDADKNESQEMLKPVRMLWLIVSIVMFNLVPMLIHGGVLPLINLLIFNAFAIPAAVLIYRKKTRGKNTY
ncbi:hypothetical protein [Morganella morganii]|uniref:hypothetical protein n=1 Tax=Morganella morganii TaxID=582 RepID=UPI000E656B30|nr:hypothetical protein [Morganella morganii]